MNLFGSIFVLLLPTVSVGKSSIYRNEKDLNNFRNVQHSGERDGGRRCALYFDKGKFEEALNRFQLNSTEEDFSSFLGNESSVELVEGENTVGVFNIDVSNPTENETEFGSIADEKGGSYNGIYDKGVIEVKLNNFEEGTIYGFGATWDIDQDIGDLVDDPYYTDNAEKMSSREEDDEWTGETWGYNEGWYEMLHIRINDRKINLVEWLNWAESDFIGVFCRQGFDEIKIFSPKKADEAIEFTMSDVIISIGEPVRPPNRFFELILNLFLFILDIFCGGGGD